jgi:hypothetical protein
VDSVIDAACFSEANGAIRLDCEGGRKPYTYTLNAESTEEELSPSGYVEGLGAGFYQVTVYDSSGVCKDTTSGRVQEPALLDTAGISIQKANCGKANGTLSAEMQGGTPPYSYQWYSGDTLAETGAKVDSLPAGVYALTATDANGCVKQVQTIELGNITAPEAEIMETTPVTCYSSGDGQVAFNVTAGTPPFTISYINSQGQANGTFTSSAPGAHQFDALPAGSYTLEVIDSLGCKRYKDFTIGSKTPLDLHINETQPTCHGYNDGAVRLTAEGANGGYQYQWEDGYSGSFREQMSADSFHVQVLDSLGCSRNFAFYLDQPEKVRVDLGKDAIICGGMEYTLSPEGYNTYYWQQDGEVIAQNQTVSLNEEGTYTLEVTDEKGCTGRDTFNLEVDNDLLQADFIIPTEADAGDTLAGIDISHPEPDSVYWHFEGSPTVFDWEASESNPYTRFIRYSDTGRFDVALYSMKAQCRDSVIKTVHIRSNGEEQQEDKLLGAEPKLIEHFSVFPNPNNGEFTVKVELKETAGIILDIISSDRNHLVDRKKVSGLKQYTLNYRFSGLAPGVYILTLRVKDAQQSLQVIIT